MNQRGQEFSVLKLAVFGVVAIALLYILTTFFAAPEQSPIKELKEAVENAQANEGTAFTKTFLLEKGFALNAGKIFDTQTRSVSFQCNSEECAKQVFDVGPRNVVVNETVSTQYTARCIFEKSIFNCKIYFGTPPAQLEINDFSLKKNYDLEKELVELNFFIKNSGRQNAIAVLVEVKIFRKEKEEQNLYSNPLTQQFELLEPGKTQQINFELPIKEEGNYIVEARVFGPDAGIKLIKTEISAHGTLITSNCKANQKQETFLNETLNKCISRYTCTECEFAIECRQKWAEKFPEKIFEESTKEQTLEITEPIHEACE